MNIYEKLWIICWVLSIPLLLVFDMLKEEFDLLLWEILFAIDVIIVSSIPFIAIIIVPIVAIINM